MPCGDHITVVALDIDNKRGLLGEREWRRKAIAWAKQQAAEQRRAATQENEREEAAGRRCSARGCRRERADKA